MKDCHQLKWDSCTSVFGNYMTCSLGTSRQAKFTDHFCYQSNGCHVVQEGDLAKMIATMGILAHYLGDACQPLHASQYFDGVQWSLYCGILFLLFYTRSHHLKEDLKREREFIPNMNPKWYDCSTQ